MFHQLPNHIKQDIFYHFTSNNFQPTIKNLHQHQQFYHSASTHHRPAIRFSVKVVDTNECKSKSISAKIRLWLSQRLAWNLKY